jgi:hypothetical protein
MGRHYVAEIDVSAAPSLDLFRDGVDFDERDAQK